MEHAMTNYTKEHTREDDARVHKIIGDKVRCLKDGTWQYEVVDAAFTTWYPVLPYTTLPNHAIDGIVLEWVQGQGEMLFEMRFCNSVRKIVLGREKDEPAKERYYLNFFLRHYKPGDYAAALLAIQEERGE